MYFLEFLDEYDFLVRDSLILLLLALSIYVLLHAGMFAVPQVGFMAIGAYVAAILATRYEAPFIVSMTLAALCGAIAGIVLALALIRLSGIYLAISTIAFGEIVRVTVGNLEIAGDGLPLVGVPRTLDDVTLVGILVFVIAGLWRLSSSRYGLAIVMIREDPLTAAHQGVSIRRYRLALFTLSGALAACAGAMSVHLTGFVEPDLFTFDLLIDALAATVLGGMTMVGGPLLGGLVIFGLPQLLHFLAEYRTLVNGLLIVAVVAFAPDGLASLVTRGWRALRPGARRADVATTDSQPVLESDGSRTAPESTEAAEGSNAPVPVLTVTGLTKTFGGVRALDSVDLDVRNHELLGIIGPNGSGKTTLINVISGVYPPTAGEVLLQGHGVGRASGHPYRMARLRISRTFQTVRLIDGHSVLDNVVAGAYVVRRTERLVPSLLLLPQCRTSQARVRREAMALLAELGLGELSHLDAASLPYGQQRKVEIARALISLPCVLLLDEPTAGMNPTERDEVFALLQRVRARGVTAVVIEHDVRAMTSSCDRLAVLNFGRLVALDTPERAIESEAVIDAYIGRST